MNEAMKRRLAEEEKESTQRLVFLQEAQEICEQVGYKDIGKCVKFLKSQLRKLAQMRA